VHRFKGGGKGSVPFQTSEARGAKRSIVAEVIQDGIPRKNLTIARFAAPNPGVGPPRPRARTAPGHPDPRDLDQGAAGLLLRRLPGRRRRRAGRANTPPRVAWGHRPGIAKNERLTIKVIGVSAGGRRGPAASARLAATKAKPTPKR